MIQLLNVAYFLTITTGAGAIFLTNTASANGVGLRVEWNVEKTNSSTPNRGEVTIYNLHLVQRQQLKNAATLPVPIGVALFVGWGQAPERLVVGEVLHLVPEGHVSPLESIHGPTEGPRAIVGPRAISGRTSGVDILTRLEFGEGAESLRDTPPAGGTDFGVGIQIAVAKLLGDLKMVPSPAAMTEIAARASALPVNVYQNVYDLEPRDQLDALMATLGLRWGDSGGFFVVYSNGILTGVPPLLLTPLSGLLDATETGDGGIEFSALAQPRLEPGVQVQFADELGVPIGGPMRCEQVTFSGNSDGESLMSGTARPLAVF